MSLYKDTGPTMGEMAYNDAHQNRKAVERLEARIAELEAKVEAIALALSGGQNGPEEPRRET